MRWPKFGLGKGKTDVELLESKLTATEQRLTALNERYETLAERAFLKGLSDHREKHILASVFSKSVRKKADIIREVEKARGYFLYPAIMELLINDSLASDVVTNEIVNLTSSNKKINDGLVDFQKRVDLDSLVLSISEDLLSYGEYFLAVEMGDAGIEKVKDCVSQESMVALYEGPTPVKYLRQVKNRLESCDADKFVHFCIGERKLRIKVSGENRIEYVRIGRPLFYGSFDLLNNLSLLTALVPASYIQKINNTSVVGIQLPEATSPEDGFKICRKYEKLLNKAVTYDPTKGDISVSDVLSQAGKFKVIPVIGSGKGSLSKVDPRYREITDISMLQELKKDVCGDAGVPYSFLYGGEKNKNDTLKQFARYVKKLHMIQKAISRGIKQLAFMDLVAKGLKPAPDHIEAKFSNTLVSVEELDRIEMLDQLISTLGNTVDTIFSIGEKAGAEVSRDKLGQFVNRYLKIVNLDSLFEFTGGTRTGTD